MEHILELLKMSPVLSIVLGFIFAGFLAKNAAIGCLWLLTLSSALTVLDCGNSDFS